jgi:hypothetical protein
VVYVVVFGGFPMGIPARRSITLLVSLSIGDSGILSVRRAEIIAPRYTFEL